MIRDHRKILLRTKHSNKISKRLKNPNEPHLICTSTDMNETQNSTLQQSEESHPNHQAIYSEQDLRRRVRVEL